MPLSSKEKSAKFGEKMKGNIARHEAFKQKDKLRKKKRAQSLTVFVKAEIRERNRLYNQYQLQKTKMCCQGNN